MSPVSAGPEMTMELDKEFLYFCYHSQKAVQSSDNILWKIFSRRVEVTVFP